MVLVVVVVVMRYCNEDANDDGASLQLQIGPVVAI